MVYCPQDPNQEQLYVVKRANAEEYESGFHSSVGPKLYRIGNAKSVANKNNSRRTKTFEPYVIPKWEDANKCSRDWHKTEEEYYIYYKEFKEHIDKHNQEEVEKGEWIVAPAIVSALT